MAMYYYASRLTALACQHRHCQRNAIPNDQDEPDEKSFHYVKPSIYSHYNGRPAKFFIRETGSQDPCSSSSTPIQNPPESPELCYMGRELVSGTLDALINLLVPTEQYSPSKEYVFTFLLSSRLFIRPHELLAQLRTKISDQETPDNNDQEKDPSSIDTISNINEVQIYAVTNDDQSKGHKSSFFRRPFRRKKSCEDVPTCHAVRGSKSSIETSRDTKKEGDLLKLVKVLTMWTELFPYDFQDELVMAQVRNITERCINEPLYVRSKISAMLENLLSRLTALENYEKQHTVKHVVPANVNLSLCIDANHLSTELGRIESERLYHIGYEEYLAMEACLAKASGRIAISTRSGSVRIRLKKLWNLECFLDWIDRLVLLAANEVCQPTTAAARATVLQLWVSTAQCCQMSGRILTCAAIVAALASEPVQRLRETWSLVPAASKLFQTLRRKVDYDPVVSHCSPSKMPAGSVSVSAGNSLGGIPDTENESELRPRGIPALTEIPALTDFLTQVIARRELCAKRLPNGHIDISAFRDLAILVQSKGSMDITRPILNQNQETAGVSDSSLAHYLQYSQLISPSDLLLLSFDRESPTMEEKSAYNIV